jgi:cell division protein FtsL
MKLEINYRRNLGKYANMWKLNNMFLNNQRVTEGSKEEIKNALRQTKICKQAKTYGMQQKQS